MISHRSIGLRTLVLFGQMVLVTLSFWGWLFIWENAFWDASLSWRYYLLHNEFLLVGIIFGFGQRRDSDGQDKEFVSAGRLGLRQTFLGLFAVFLVVFLTHDARVSRSFFLSYVPWLYATLLFSNYLGPRSLAKWAFSGDRQERVALAGTVEQASRLKPWLERKSLVGLRTVGLVAAGPVPVGPLPYPVLGKLEEVADILRDQSITQLIVLDLSIGAHCLRKLTQLCEEAAVRLLALNDLNTYFNHTTTTFEDDGVRFIGLRNEPLESPVNRFLKRALDLSVAVPVVVLLLPFTTLLVWVLHRLQSPGPVFYRQMRAGMMGRPFAMYKYRTMHVNNTAAKQATADDPRVFPAGRWLRKLSLDELPQFINVVLGNMSVVGPRPHLPQHEEMFVRVMRKYLIRKFILPGITGWAQVNGYRGEVHTEADIQRRVEADIYYLEHWSLSLDCLVILQTIRHCVKPPPSAY